MIESLQNRILSRLAPGDFELLEPNLEPADLPLRKVLERRDRRITAVYFPESGFASVVADGGRTPIEVGLIGREGMTGVAILLGGDRGAHEVFIQVAGRAHCIRSKALREAMNKSISLHHSFLRFAHTFLNQTTQTAAVNGRCKLEERLARWLLMAADRLDDAELPLTQEFLSMMLGVRRSGVTLALQLLERRAIVTRSRGNIIIKDRMALVRLSNGTYLASDR